MARPDPGAHIAAPISFTAKGEQYLLSPLRLVDMRELETFLRGRPIKDAKSHLEGLSFELQTHMLDRATEASKKIRIGTDEFAAESQSFDGVAYMLWLCIRQTHPDITLDQAVALFSENSDALMPLVNAVAGHTSDPTKPDGAPASRSKRKTTARLISAASTAI